MKTKIISITTVLTIMSGASLLAITSPQTTTAPASPAAQFQTVAFSDSAEAGMMHRAYRILAYGDHDYKGHRVAAMNQVKKAADLRGDDRDKERQVLSDDQLRNARDLLTHVLENSDVKGQDKIAKHIHNAIDQIDKALSIR